MKENTMDSPSAKASSAPQVGDLKWYAGLAMQAIMAKHANVPTTESEREEISLWAWRMGQAMIATEKRIHIGH